MWCLHVLGCQSVLSSSMVSDHLATPESVLRSSLRMHSANVMRNSHGGQALSQVLGLWHWGSICLGGVVGVCVQILGLRQ